MPVVQGAPAVTGRQTADESLRAAFRALGDTARETCSEEDLERIWRAVAGELPAAERRVLVDRMATDPACAEAWRVAEELRRASQGESISSATPLVRSWSRSWLATAAVLVLGVAIGLVSWLNRPQGDEFRNLPGYVVDSLVPSEAPLAREAFRLRWTPGPQGARYQVRVTTDDLRVLATADDLTVPELLVERERLTSLSPGARVLWQVDVVLPNGERVSSQTFVVRVQ
jgi:hypothetical protein